MARSEARISVEIWAPESDFKILTPTEQWMYFFLVSQQDLAHDGVIALRGRRWSKQAAGVTPEEIALYLAGLVRHRYIVIDDDTEELLIRSFIRRDKVFRQPNVLRAAHDHLGLVTSAPIRQALAVELRRIQLLEMPKDSVAIIAQMIEDIGEPVDTPWSNPYGKGSGNPSDESSAKDAPATPGERGGTDQYKYEDPDLPRTTNPESETFSASDEPMRDEDDFALIPPPPEPAHPHEAPKRAWSKDQIYADPHFKEFWSVFPLKADKPEAAAAWLKHLRNGVDPAEITKGAQRYRDDPARSRERQYIKHPPGWLNNEKWADDTTVTPPPTQSGGWWNN